MRTVSLKQKRFFPVHWYFHLQLALGKPRRFPFEVCCEIDILGVDPMVGTSGESWHNDARKLLVMGSSSSSPVYSVYNGQKKLF